MHDAAATATAARGRARAHTADKFDIGHRHPDDAPAVVFRHMVFQLREERGIKPETFASLVSALIYEKSRRGENFALLVGCGPCKEMQIYVGC